MVFMTRTFRSFVSTEFFYAASHSNVTSRYCIWSGVVGLVWHVFLFLNSVNTVVYSLAMYTSLFWSAQNLVLCEGFVQVSSRSGCPSAFSCSFFNDHVASPFLEWTLTERGPLCAPGVCHPRASHFARLATEVAFSCKWMVAVVCRS